MWRVGVPYDKALYGVLGDDIVIFNKRVADEYLEVCKHFGIPIGLAKSYVSTTDETQEAQDMVDLLEEGILHSSPSSSRSPSALFNFANQTYWRGLCFSVISLKEELRVATLDQRLALGKRVADRG
jgi:hypothetical protein